MSQTSALKLSFLLCISISRDTSFHTVASTEVSRILRDLPGYKCCVVTHPDDMPVFVGICTSYPHPLGNESGED